MNMEKQEAVKFFSDFFFGEHHFPGKLNEWGPGWCMVATNNLSTYDFNHLTRLVVMAHDRCIRVEIVPKGMNRMIIVIHKRVNRDGAYFERHPTMEQAIEQIRSKQVVGSKTA